MKYIVGVGKTKLFSHPYLRTYTHTHTYTVSHKKIVGYAIFKKDER